MTLNRRTNDAILLAQERLVDARLARSRHDNAKAIRLFESIAEFNAPRESAEANLERADLLFDRHHFESATTALREASKTILNLGDGLLLFDLGLAWAKAGNLDDAERVLDGIVTLAAARAYLVEHEPEPPTQRHLRAAASFLRWDICGKRGEEPDRVTWLECAVECRDASISPYAAIELARWIRNANGRVKRAEWLLREAMSYDHPDASPEAAFSLAELLIQRGLFAPARAVLESIRIQSGHHHWAAESTRLITRLASMSQSGMPPRARSSGVNDTPRRKRRIIVVGAGTGGQYLVEDLGLDGYARERHEIVGVLDDDPSRKDAITAMGLPWCGSISDLGRILGDPGGPEEVWLAMPTAPPDVKRFVAETCHIAAVPLRTLPSVHDIVRSMDLHKQLRPVDFADLEGEPIESHLDFEAVSWLRTRKVMIIGCGALGTQLALAAARAGADSIVLVDREDLAAQRLRRALVRANVTGSVHAHQGSSVDAKHLVPLAERHSCDVVLSAAGGWHGRDVNGGRYHRALSGLLNLVQGFDKLPALEYFALIADGNTIVLSDMGDALDLAAEAVVLNGAATSHYRSCVIRVPPSYTSGRSVLADMRRDAASGAVIAIPSIESTCRFLSASRSAELVLASTRSAAHGELLALNGGNDVPLRQAAQTLLMLSERDPADEGAIALDPSVEIDEAPRPVGRPTGIPGVVSLGTYAHDPARDAALRGLTEVAAGEFVTRVAQTCRHVSPAAVRQEPVSA